jgi:hypothetical protein
VNITPKARKHDVEALIREGKSFSVGLLEGDLQAIGFGTLAPALEQRGHIVRRHDVGEAPGRGESRIAVAGGDIEDALVLRRSTASHSLSPTISSVVPIMA